MSKVLLKFLSLALLSTFRRAIAYETDSNVDIGSSYTLWCQGVCDKDLSTKTTPGAVLMGGGTDTTEAFEWQIKNANKGDFLVLRASGDDAYNDYIYKTSVAIGYPLHSVTTILFKNSKANQEKEVVDKIKNAEAIFFAGGDQNDYLTLWTGTEIQSIIQSKVANVTIGGTSAGLAILGNWVYSAEIGSVESDTAMANPYNKEITLVPAFLKFPFLETIITDTHFVTRDRMGRMLTFVARIITDNKLPLVRGVGVDEHTALLVDHFNGDVQVVGVGTAYVCTGDHAPTVCKSGTPLTFQDISCTRLEAKSNDYYSFATFTGKQTPYFNSVSNGKLSPNAYNA